MLRVRAREGVGRLRSCGDSHLRAAPAAHALKGSRLRRRAVDPGHVGMLHHARSLARSAGEIKIREASGRIVVTGLCYHDYIDRDADA